MNTKHIGRRIGWLMKIKNIPSNNQLSKLSGVSQPTISRIRMSNTRPLIDNLDKISKALKVPLEVITHPNDFIAEMILEASELQDVQLQHFIEEIKKEKVYSDFKNKNTDNKNNKLVES